MSPFSAFALCFVLWLPCVFLLVFPVSFSFFFKRRIFNDLVGCRCLLCLSRFLFDVNLRERFLFLFCCLFCFSFFFFFPLLLAWLMKRLMHWHGKFAVLRFWLFLRLSRSICIKAAKRMGERERYRGGVAQKKRSRHLQCKKLLLIG